MKKYNTLKIIIAVGLFLITPVYFLFAPFVMFMFAFGPKMLSMFLSSTGGTIYILLQVFIGLSLSIHFSRKIVDSYIQDVELNRKNVGFRFIIDIAKNIFSYVGITLVSMFILLMVFG